MKKIFLSFFALVVCLIITTTKTQAQCSISLSDVRVQIVNAIPIGATCQVTFNVSFKLDYNSGAKFVYFNSYFAADYDALAITNPLDFECSSGSTPARNAPDAGRLGTSINQSGKSILDIGLDLTAGHPALNATLPTTVLTTYSQDPTVALNTPINSGGFTVTRTSLGGTLDSFSIINMTLTLNATCGGPLSVKTDVWASNANSASAKAQCYICGVTQFFNDPSVAGLHKCTFPLSYDLSISTIDPSPKTITYKTFVDVDYSGTLNSGDLLAFTSAPIIISSSSPFQVMNQTYDPASSNSANFDKDIIILVEGPTLSNSIIKLIPNGDCGTLPIVLKSFTANRNRTNVNLKWETATEDNNRGFEVQRRLGSSGNWQAIGFVNSKAQDGNSAAPLNYELNDINGTRGITQYRLKQIDIDNKYSYSVIRAVRGEEQKGKTIIFPNPSSDGRLNVVFEDINVKRDVTLIDMNGRTIKQWKGVTNNNIQIENLNAGFYSIRILNTETGEQVVEKVVVNKR